LRNQQFISFSFSRILGTQEEGSKAPAAETHGTGCICPVPFAAGKASHTLPRASYLSTFYPPHPDSYALSDRARYAGRTGIWHEAKKQEKRYLLLFIFLLPE
jgi:hypothetical protein